MKLRIKQQIHFLKLDRNVTTCQTLNIETLSEIEIFIYTSTTTTIIYRIKKGIENAQF